MIHYPFKLFGVPLSTLTVDAIYAQLLSWLKKEDRVRFVFTPNPEILLKAKKDREYKEVLKNADILLPDGSGIMYASKVLGSAVHTTVTGVDVAEYLLAYASRHGLRVCVVLAEEGRTSVRQAREYFEAHYSDLSIHIISADRHYRKSGHLVADVVSSKPELLLVTFGAPDQEKWLMRHKHALRNVHVAMGIGGGIDMIVGTVTRAPKVFRDNHLEWVWRFFTAEKKLWRLKRIFNATIVFPIHVLKDVYRSKWVFRKNVLAFIFHDKDSILIIHKKYKDTGHGFWAMPQGGVDEGETEEQALYREVEEEVGLSQNIKIVGRAAYRHKYRWPVYHRSIFAYQYAGQYQRSFFVRANDTESVIIHDDEGEPIDDYRWVSQEDLLKLLEDKRKKNVEILLKEFNEKKIYERR